MSYKDGTLIRRYGLHKEMLWVSLRLGLTVVFSKFLFLYFIVL